MRFRSDRQLFYFFAFFLVFPLLGVLVSVRNLSAAACTFDPNTPVDCSSDANCDDGDPCNGTEVCGRCGGGLDDFSVACCRCGAVPPDNTVSCASDGTFCNGNELCAGGTCSAHSGNPCSGTECNTCNETNDNCFDTVGTGCTDDFNPCTTDECNGSGTCVHSNNNFECNDGVNCTIDDVCSGGVCSGTAVQCDDKISCTLDACDEPSGLCQFDNSKCECRTDADCDDNNICTDEFCCNDPKNCAVNVIFTCVRSNNTNPCDDGLFCNGTDTCQGGTCSVHTGDPCTTGGQCDATCSESADNCFAVTGTACDDGNVVTINECDGGGKCIVSRTLESQGATLGCSLHAAGESASGWGFLAWMLSGAAWLFVRNRRSLS